MARKQSKVERFTQECMSSSPEELDLMFQIIKGIRGKTQPATKRGPAKPKVVAKKDEQAQSG